MKLTKALFSILIISLLAFSRFAFADEKTVTVEVPVNLTGLYPPVKDFYVMHAFTVNEKVVLNENISQVKFWPTPAPTGDPKNKKINFNGKITLKLKPEVGLAPGTKVDYVCILMLNRAEGFYGRPARPKWILAVPEDWWPPAELAAVEDYWTYYEYLAEQDGSSWTTLPAIPFPNPLGMMGGEGDSPPVGVVGVDGTIEFQPGKTITVGKIVMTGVKGPATFEDIPEEIKEWSKKKKPKFKAFKIEMDKTHVSAPPLQMTGMLDQWGIYDKAVKDKYGKKSMERGAGAGAGQMSTQPGTSAAPSGFKPKIFKLGGAAGGASPTQAGAASEEEIQ